MFGNVTNHFTFPGDPELPTDVSQNGLSQDGESSNSNTAPAIRDDYVMVDFRRPATPPAAHGGPSLVPPTGPRYLRVRALEVPSLETADVSVDAITNHLARATYVGLEHLITKRPTAWVPELPGLPGSAARFERVFWEAQIRAKDELETAASLANALVLRTRSDNPELPLKTIARAVEKNVAAAWATSYQARDANRLLTAVKEDSELQNFMWDARLLRLGARFEAYLDASATQALSKFSALKP